MSCRWYAALLLVLVGCARPAFIPSGNTSLSSEESAAIVHGVQLANAPLTDLRGLYRVRREEAGRSTTLRAAIQLTPEGRFVVETFPITSFIALHTLTLSSMGSSFEDHTKRERVVLDREEALLLRLFGVALHREDLLAVVQGSLPSAEAWSATRSRDGAVVLRSSNGQWLAKLTPDSLQVEALELRDLLRQQPRLQVQYLRRGAPAEPEELSVLFPRIGVHLQLTRVR